MSSSPSSSQNNRLPDITESAGDTLNYNREIFNIGSSDFIRKYKHKRNMLKKRRTNPYKNLKKVYDIDVNFI